MPKVFNESLKKKICSALENKSLQKALRGLQENTKARRSEALAEINFEQVQQDLRALKEKAVEDWPELIAQFKENAEKAGCIVLEAKTKEEANELIDKIAQENQVKKIIKSKSMLTEELGLNHFLEARGREVIETDLGEFIIQIAGEKPSHMTVPAIHKSKEEIAVLLSDFFGREIKPDLDEMIGAVRSYLRKKFIEAEMGVTGANLAIAETGSLVLVTNEGNGRLVSTLPPVHVAVVGYDKLVSSLDEANEILKILSRNANGQKLTSYVSFITGPSRTSDIEKELYIGVHGPRKVYIVLVDNGRSDLRSDDDFKELLYCLRCGACLNACPSFLKLGGQVFGGETYTGGIGSLLEYHLSDKKRSLEISKLCLACGKCAQVCPVGIKIPDLIAKMRSRAGEGRLKNKAAYLGFKNKKFFGGVMRMVNVAVGARRRLAPTDGQNVVGARLIAPLPQDKNNRIAIFGGCLIEEMFPHLIDDLLFVLRTLGVEAYYPKNQTCCGVYHWKHGGDKYAAKFAAQNREAFSDADKILTLCATCEDMLRNKIPVLCKGGRSAALTDRIVSFTDFFMESIVSKPFVETWQCNVSTFTKKVACHIPCHSKTYEKVIYDFLEKAGVPYVKTAYDNDCCGFGGDFSFAFPKVSSAIFDQKFEALKKSGAEVLVTDCPGCLWQFKKELAKRGFDCEVWHTVELIKALLPTPRGHGEITVKNELPKTRVSY